MVGDIRNSSCSHHGFCKCLELSAPPGIRRMFLEHLRRGRWEFIVHEGDIACKILHYVGRVGKLTNSHMCYCISALPTKKSVGTKLITFFQYHNFLEFRPLIWPQTPPLNENWRLAEIVWFKSRCKKLFPNILAAASTSYTTLCWHQKVVRIPRLTHSRLITVLSAHKANGLVQWKLDIQRGVN